MIVALVGKAYTGKTSIAQELRDKHGFVLLSFTDHLKDLATIALNAVRGGQTPITVEDILADKPKYRRFIQEFGSLIGYESDSGWVAGYLLDELLDLAAHTDSGMPTDPEMPNGVIDCLRSAAQIEGARRFGAKIVGLAADEWTRALNATGNYMSGIELVRSADAHPIDGDLDVERMDCDVVVTNARGVPIPDLVSSVLSSLQRGDL